ncbi:hypothetical protein [Xanthomonas euroxanthea]|uniref:hypothetical protein n=1 Tax=Xanthomonas euroxanthea TaxID=2259622 RepID=UPI00160E0CF0|nr:hypothetical protein [Xanthomonas euroxanthea]
MAITIRTGCRQFHHPLKIRIPSNDFSTNRDDVSACAPFPIETADRTAGTALVRCAVAAAPCAASPGNAALQRNRSSFRDL